MIYLVMFYAGGQFGDFGEAHVVSAHGSRHTANLAITDRVVETGTDIHDYYVTELEIT